MRKGNTVVFCKKCGNEMPDYATRCDKCGTKVKNQSTAKRGFNKLLFVPIGIGSVAVTALVVALVFILRPKKPSGIGEPASLPSEIQASVSDTSAVTPPVSTPGSNSQPSESKAPAVSSNSPAVTPPVSTPDSSSQPNENKPSIPDALTIKINGDKLAVSEAGYSDSINMALREDLNGIMIWGKSDRYVASVLVGIKHEQTKANSVHNNLGADGVGELMAKIIIFDKQNNRTYIYHADKKDKNELKIGDFEPRKFINVSFSGTMYNGDVKFEFSSSGKCSYCTPQKLEEISKHASEAMADAISENIKPVSEVVIAGESYSLDTWYIDLTRKNVTNADVENLQYLTNLTNIQLSNNSGVTDISALSGLTKLEILCLDDTEVSDLSPLSGCKNLRELGIKNTNVKDISALSKCTKLSKLIAVNCKISDISPVAKCSDMREIQLTKNPITDFSPLVKLNNLDTVGVDNCCKMTWAIMETLYGLHFTTELNVAGNGLTEEMAIELSKNVRSKGGELWF